MTAWKAEVLFTMQVLNVDEPLQQAEQACPEGAAFMTAAWGHHSHPETQFFMSKQEQQPQQTLVPFLIKLPETVSFTEDKGFFWLPGEISAGKQDIARRDYVQTVSRHWETSAGGLTPASQPPQQSTHADLSHGDTRRNSAIQNPAT